jgi:anti-anti-sigma factor
MNRATCSNPIYAQAQITELVRGQTECLWEQIAPLVRRQNVELDLKKVERIDAAGIAELVSLYGCARDAGHCFMVSNASERVAGILRIVGLDHVLLSQNAMQQSQSGPLLESTAA